MATRIVKSLPGTGSVPRRKIRAAVRALQKSSPGSDRPVKKVIRNGDTASGRGLIGFRKPGHKATAA